jgi:FkbM family methyltransferase
MVSPGDWALDVGANVGHYALRLSELVGDAGRVIALEPVPDTFEVLAANIRAASAGNVTLINVAASDSSRLSGMVVPKYEDSQSDNFYLARLAGDGSAVQVLCITVDSLNLPHRVRLVKIDTEGHELAVMKGMRGILERDKPLLIVEDNDPAVAGYLVDLGYASQKIDGSSNRIFSQVASGLQVGMPAIDRAGQDQR